MDPASERVLLRSPAEVQVQPRSQPFDDRALRSYLGDGRRLLWLPSPFPEELRLAVDAELASRSVPPALARWAGGQPPHSFWEQWTRVETACKLRDVPVVRWLRTHGLETDPAVYSALDLRTFRHADVVVTCGAAPYR